jgi:hypothetical protein
MPRFTKIASLELEHIKRLIKFIKQTWLRKAFHREAVNK